MAFSPTSITDFGGEIYHVTSAANLPWTTAQGITGILFTDAAALVQYVGGVNRTDIYIKLPNRTTDANYLADLSQVGGASMSVTITGQILILPSFSLPMTVELRGTIINVKRDGSINGRILGDGVLRRDYNLHWDNNVVANYLEMENFWLHHAPGKNRKIRYLNPMLVISGSFMFDSPLYDIEFQSHNRMSWRAAIKNVP